MVSRVMFSSARSTWATPQTFFKRLDAEFSFDLDAAANTRNAKCSNFLSEKDNALRCAWPGLRAWCNPPYSKGNGIGKWVAKFVEEIEQGEPEEIVALVGARTDTRWFQSLVWPIADEVRFVNGRLVFEIDGEPLWGATFPSIVLVFRKEPLMRGKRGPRQSIIPALTDKERAQLKAEGYFERMRNNQAQAKVAAAQAKAAQYDEAPL